MYLRPIQDKAAGRGCGAWRAVDGQGLKKPLSSPNRFSPFCSWCVCEHGSVAAIPSPTPAQFETGERRHARCRSLCRRSSRRRTNRRVQDRRSVERRTRPRWKKSPRTPRCLIASKPGADAMTRMPPRRTQKGLRDKRRKHKKALQQFPDGAAIAYQLGRAFRCQQQASPEKVPMAIYEFARAAAIDPHPCRHHGRKP